MHAMGCIEPRETPSYSAFVNLILSISILTRCLMQPSTMAGAGERALGASADAAPTRGSALVWLWVRPALNLRGGVSLTKAIDRFWGMN